MAVARLLVLEVAAAHAVRGVLCVALQIVGDVGGDAEIVTDIKM